MTGLDAIGLPVVMVCRPNSRSLSVSQGKGLDLASAEASGLMEAAELWHAERISLPLRLATYNEVRFRNRVARISALPRVSVRSFRDELPMLWIEGTNLLDGQPLLLPYEAAHFNVTLPLPPGSGCFPTSTNGLASGNHLLEAINHGLCEVIERDAATLWDLSGIERMEASRIELDSIDDRLCLEALGYFERARVAVGVWEITSDIGVPSFRAEITDREADPFHPRVGGCGFGCHPTRGIALLRALTEAAQSRLTSIAGARDDMPRSSYNAWRDPDHLEHSRRQILTGNPRRSFREAPTFESETFDDDLSWLLERLRIADLPEVIAIDLTHLALGLPVVRVVVPGLETSREIPGWIPGVRAQAAAAR